MELRFDTKHRTADQEIVHRSGREEKTGTVPRQEPRTPMVEFFQTRTDRPGQTKAH